MITAARSTRTDVTIGHLRRGCAGGSGSDLGGSGAGSSWSTTIAACGAVWLRA